MPRHIPSPQKEITALEQGAQALVVEAATLRRLGKEPRLARYSAGQSYRQALCLLDMACKMSGASPREIKEGLASIFKSERRGGAY